MTVSIILGILLVLVVAGALLLAHKLRVQKVQHESALARYSGVVNADAERERILRETEAERARVHAEIASRQAEQERLTAEWSDLRTHAETEAARLREAILQLRYELEALEEEANLQSFGFYKPRYGFGDSLTYDAELERIREQQKSMLKEKTAAVCTTEWVVDGSRAEGRKATNQQLKLMLRAFNGESDAAIAKVKYNNVGVMLTRIRKAWEVINGLGQAKHCTISPAYLQLKLDELQLVHEYQEKVQAEKEEQRRIREQMREEELALREMEKARVEAEREEKRYEDALRKARADVEQAVGEKQEKLLAQIEELQRRLAEAHERKERAIARAQMTRSGHVYVISNVGSFGEQIYKIGMTRRLDPMERVKELGDASVPFQFDVHAVIYSEDAPGLEATLHREFQDRRVNCVNERKEFFHVSIDEIVEAVHRHHGEITITKAAEAEEYNKTLAILRERVASGETAAADLLALRMAQLGRGLAAGADTKALVH